MLAFGASTFRCARNSVTKLEQLRLEKSTVLKGLLVGLLAGGAAGAVLGAVTYRECVDEPGGGWDCFMAPTSAGEQAVFGGIGGGALGALIGGLTGIPSKIYWEEVSLDRVRVSVAPQRKGGVALGVSVRF
jgi:hypothetical protein